MSIVRRHPRPCRGRSTPTVKPNGICMNLYIDMKSSWVSDRMPHGFMKKNIWDLSGELQESLDCKPIQFSKSIRHKLSFHTCKLTSHDLVEQRSEGFRDDEHGVGDVIPPFLMTGSRSPIASRKKWFMIEPALPKIRPVFELPTSHCFQTWKVHLASQENISWSPQCHKFFLAKEPGRSSSPGQRTRTSGDTKWLKIKMGQWLPPWANSLPIKPILCKYFFSYGTKYLQYQWQ